MPEEIGEKKVYTLKEVLTSVQRTISNRYKSAFWVKAEMNKLNYYPKSGHCYPEIVERMEDNLNIHLRANLWRTDYERINKNFISVLGEKLKDGIKILFYAKINFDLQYGLQLIILDIDPSYSLGELEKEKQQTISKLKEEGLFYNNKSLILPLLPKRIAIISVETSKGFADFKEIIDNNTWGYKFFYMLFPSLLQGEKSITEIIAQLKRIDKVKQHFDLVAIIRGGGGDLGLSAFNNYQLAKEIALFPIPVITGIGHATNETVVEMVAYKNAITPTELADFLIQKFHDFNKPLTEAQLTINNKVVNLLKICNVDLSHYAKILKLNTFTNSQKIKLILSESINKVNNFSINISKQENSKLNSTIKALHVNTNFIIERNDVKFSEKCRELKNNTEIIFIERKHKLEVLNNEVNNYDPVLIFKRGYTITRNFGKISKTVDKFKENDIIETILIDGTIESQVKKILKNNNKKI